MYTKLYEELMSEEETSRTCELDRYFAVLPAFRSLYREIKYDYPTFVSQNVSNVYHSGNESPLNQEDLLEFLTTRNLLLPSQKDSSHPAERYWPNGSSNE